LGSFVYGLFEPTAETQKYSTADEAKPGEEMQKGTSKQKRQLPPKWPMHDPRDCLFTRLDRLFRRLTKKPKDVDRDQPTTVTSSEHYCPCFRKIGLTIKKRRVRSICQEYSFNQAGGDYESAGEARGNAYPDKA
jgi:hypothetical protein